MNGITRSEIEKFECNAEAWWDPNAEYRTLHQLNPLRSRYVKECIGSLEGLKILDLGCGGGIFSEELSNSKAHVTGVDASAKLIEIAIEHAKKMSLSIEYEVSTAELHAKTHAHYYDVITCMEMLEHVPNPGQIITAIGEMLKPGGALILSTLNRTKRSYIEAIIGAEYVFGLLPKNTHQYQKFIRPAEIDRWARRTSLNLSDVRGVRYNPLTEIFSLSKSVAVNYLMYYQKKHKSRAE